MITSERPIILSAPAPRTLDLLFSPKALRQLKSRYEVIETDETGLPALSDDVLTKSRYIIGQPALDMTLVFSLTALQEHLPLLTEQHLAAINPIIVPHGRQTHQKTPTTTPSPKPTAPLL